MRESNGNETQLLTYDVVCLDTRLHIVLFFIQEFNHGVDKLERLI